jgi:hypothetical protein
MQGTILWKGVSLYTMLPAPICLPLPLPLPLCSFSFPFSLPFLPPSPSSINFPLFPSYFFSFHVTFIRNQQGIYTYLSNRADLLVRECVKNYYDCWLVCDDRACARRTMQQASAGEYQTSSHNPSLHQFSFLFFSSRLLVFTSSPIILFSCHPLVYLHVSHL